MYDWDWCIANLELCDVNCKTASAADKEKNRMMQWTGLLDKNSKEIYEGDIVFFDDFYIGDHRQVGGNGVIKFIDDGWCVFAFNEYQSGLWNMVNNFSAEVIGNIYENPELLK
jgi:uncharacterized phage protein (TIGR01671 family)